MRHRRRHKSLHLWRGVNRALLRSLAQAVLLEGRIETTLSHAKEVRRHIDHLITLGKEGSLQARRRALQMLGKEEPVKILFSDLAPLFKKRQGGYTRVVRSWTRLGDGAQLAVLELTEQRPLPQKEVKVKEKKTPEPKPSPPEAKRPKEAPVPEKPKVEEPKVKKPSGFLGSLRRFLKPKDRSSS